ncbi:hypothetical protein EVAR_27314_1 [Eumeta japonica]|uniref:Uncharacterized protein n=1 Tax=Eumeta variegata TaxID=151549 RepID=A0A4C1UCC5_EUMVA|nr:hypothetical protein EVAR_27314_1 [Eumeta japonica]
MNAGCVHEKAGLIVAFRRSLVCERERGTIERHDRPKQLDTSERINAHVTTYRKKIEAGAVPYFMFRFYTVIYSTTIRLDCVDCDRHSAHQRRDVGPPSKWKLSLNRAVYKNLTRENSRKKKMSIAIAKVGFNIPQVLIRSGCVQNEKSTTKPTQTQGHVLNDDKSRRINAGAITQDDRGGRKTFKVARRAFVRRHRAASKLTASKISLRRRRRRRAPRTPRRAADT